ncbi:YncE family protein [Youngiibacter fragilis]|uniref:Anaphase-promoting complex subunit 4 WD40 domain-containing protein n=1 Tax=Youngiibacter fragilis 232.1 TaxID=994573 RepID=V7I9H1_9CLOT|nr:hypothetical protein [Youngiibacter fragilis]ETA81936.1 hypothetical protein T472_0203755 [Youngiibacter fragilis 232.1]
MKGNFYLHKFKHSYEIKMSSDAKYICRLSASKVYLHDAKTFEEITSWDNIKNPRNISFSNNNKYLAVTNSMGKVALYDLFTISFMKSFRIGNGKHSQDCNLCFTHDDKFAIAAINSHVKETIVSIDLQSIEIREHAGIDYSVIQGIQCVESKNKFIFYFYDRNDSSGYGKNYIILWEYPFESNQYNKINSKQIREWGAIDYNENTECYSIYASNDLYIADNKLDIIRKTGECKSNEEISINPMEITKKVIGEDNINDRLISICESMNSKFPKDGYLSHLSWSKDGKFIAVVFSEVIKLIRCDDLSCVREFRLPYSCYASFSPNGQYLLIGTWNCGYVVEMGQCLEKD